MKTLAELQEIRDRMKMNNTMRGESTPIRIVVGMATCGIAAGARPVLNTLLEEVSARGLSKKASVVQTGCIGICRFEPVVEVYEEGKEKVTYVKVTPEKAKEIVSRHILNGNVITAYTIGAAET